MNIVSFASLIALSVVGLVVAIKKHPISLAIYGIGLNVIYATSLLHVSRLKPIICVFVVFISILAFIHSRQLFKQQSANKVDILQVNSDLIKDELIKDDRIYKYEPANITV